MSTPLNLSASHSMNMWFPSFSQYDLLLEPAPAFLISLGALALIAGIAVMLRAYHAYRHRNRSRMISRELRSVTHAEYFTAAEIGQMIHPYVEPLCVKVPPDHASRRADQLPECRGLFSAVDELVNMPRGNRYVLVAADSGLGKSAFCINFFARELLLTPHSARRRLAVVALDGADVLRDIRSIAKKQETVLVLDGLDQYLGPGHAATRMRPLIEETMQFKAVIMACNARLLAETPTEQLGLPPDAVIRVLPLNSLQINRYIRQLFPGWSFLRRSRARRLAADVDELGSHPLLLPFLPLALRASGRISGLFDFYRVVINHGIRQQGSWLAPDKPGSSRNLTGAGRQGADFLTAAAERSGLIASLPAQVSRHESTRSLTRSSEGVPRFAHDCILDFFLVKGFIEADGACKDLEWTPVMRSLFLSWSKGEGSGQQLERAKRILSRDLRNTGLLPFCCLPPACIHSSIAQLDRDSTKPRGRHPEIPLAWHAACSRMLEEEEVLHLFDMAYGLRWRIIRTNRMASLEEIKLYRLSLSQASTTPALSALSHPGAISASPGERLPSLEEFTCLWELESSLGHGGILDRREFYWLGDRLGKTRYLACSLGTEPISHELLTVVAERKSKNRKQRETLFIYEVAMRASAVFHNQLFSAQACLVWSTGEADWYQFRNMRTGAAGALHTA